MNLIVDSDVPQNDSPRPGLVGWLLARLDPWRTHRDTNHKGKWDEYYRLWRGMADPSDKQRKSERAKIIVPATMQAVDSTVAEIEEALFGREQWFDLEQDLLDIKDPAKKAEMTGARDLLRERMEQYRVPQAVSKAVLIGALYGTGIGKIVTSTKMEDYGNGKREVVCVELVAVEPLQFIPDPTTDSIDEMLGVFHETTVPLHRIRQMMEDGVYRKVEVQPYEGPNAAANGEQMTVPNSDAVLIAEYHGLVPAKLLLAAQGDQNEASQAVMDSASDLDLVESIVTIANGSTLLNAKPNPIKGEDRSFVAYQHDSIPGYFWGRGVVEKAYHPQKALDTTVRARLDAQALVAHPMIAGDVTRLPRGMNLGVWPGKFWGTTGAPGEVIQGFSLGNVNPTLFENAADMERMVQTATGAMDPGASFNQNTSGPTDRAMFSSAFIKRSRRTMQRIEMDFLRPLVNKIYLRYAQFDGEFPKDYTFRIKGTLGIMAREIEQQQMTQTLALVPQDSKPFYAIVKAIFDNSSSPHKAEISSAIEEWVNPPQNPEAEQMQQQMMQMQMQTQQLAMAEQEARTQKAQAEAQLAMARAQKTLIEADTMDEEQANEQIKNAINLREVEAFEEQNKLSMITTQLKGIELAIKALLAEANLEKIKQQGQTLAS